MADTLDVFPLLCDLVHTDGEIRRLEDEKAKAMLGGDLDYGIECVEALNARRAERKELHGMILRAGRECCQAVLMDTVEHSLEHDPGIVLRHLWPDGLPGPRDDVLRYLRNAVAEYRAER